MATDKGVLRETSELTFTGSFCDLQVRNENGNRVAQFVIAMTFNAFVFFLLKASERGVLVPLLSAAAFGGRLLRDARMIATGRAVVCIRQLGKPPREAPIVHPAEALPA